MIIYGGRGPCSWSSFTASGWHQLFMVFWQQMKKLDVLLCVFLCFVVSVECQSSPDNSAMQALKSRLLNPTGWSDPDPCNWHFVVCSNGRVTKIQIGDKKVSEGGTLPPDLKKLTSLTTLEVMRSNFSGPIPSLAGLSSLERVLLNDNNFTEIPSDFFTGLTSLKEIFLDNNPLSAWQIPENLKDASNSLASFSANGANVVGTIPDFLGGDTFPVLTLLHLAFHNLEGSIPSSFAKSSIQSLWLNSTASKSKLGGSIAVIQNMTTLTELWLHGNNFTGPIPDLSGLRSLQTLSLRDNQLTGIVPQSVLDLPLKTVNLSNNLLQGPTPKFDTSKVAVDMNNGSNSFCLDEPGVACDSRVNVLLSILQPLGYPAVFAQAWKGNDPCSQSWKGLTCEGENITVVNFEKLGLSGTISPDFSNLTSLKTLLLANNNLIGTIPNELTTLSSLNEIDVSNNRLHGKVPNFGKNVIVKTDGNSDIGKDINSPPSSSGGSGEGSSGSGSKNSNTGKVVGSVVGAVWGAFIVGIGVCLYARKRRNTNRVQSSSTVVTHPRNEGDGNAVQIHAVEAGNKAVSIQVLRDVTNNFSEENLLGRGGFGSVYKGEWQDGKKIAVKRMEAGVVTKKQLAEFKNEIAVLTKVRHRHLVALLGHCLEQNERILIYEYMPQGTLSRHLFNWKQQGLKPLEWNTRLTIALDVARGVEYLHSLAHQSFVHRDLKPSNILLGHDLRAKVADFGLVRLSPENGQRLIETRVAGTFGYLDPDYAVTGQMTTKIDLFSFGVILMELLTGRKAVDSSQPEEVFHLVSWFRRMHADDSSLPNAIDQTLELDDETVAGVSTVAQLALHCCAEKSHSRPNMACVVNVLSSLVEQWKPAEPEPDDTSELDLDFASLPLELHSHAILSDVHFHTV